MICPYVVTYCESGATIWKSAPGYNIEWNGTANDMIENIINELNLITGIKINEKLSKNV